MLIDPENVETWELEVRAKNLNAARSQCEAIAATQPLTEVLSVTQATITPYEGTYRFICWFNSEVTENDSGDDR